MYRFSSYLCLCCAGAFVVFVFVKDRRKTDPEFPFEFEMVQMYGHLSSLRNLTSLDILRASW